MHGLCLSSTTARSSSVIGLTKVDVDFSTALDPTFFAGASPEKVLVVGDSVSKNQASTLGDLLNSARDVYFDFREFSSRDVTQLKVLGPFLSNVTKMDIDLPDNDLSNLLAGWFKHMKNLTHLELPGRDNVAPILKTAAVCPKLEFVTLKEAENNDDFSLKKISDSLKRLKALKTVLISEMCEEIGNARLCSSTAGQVGEMEKLLKKIAKLLPSLSLNNVFVRARVNHTFDVNLFAFLFAFASEEELCKFLLSKLKQAGVDTVCHEESDTALAFLFAVGHRAMPEEEVAKVPNKIEMLLDAGAHPLHRAILQGFLGGKACSSGTVFHSAAVYGELAHVKDFLRVLEQRDFPLEASALRTSEGFTPAHFAGSSCAAWIAITDFLKNRSLGSLLTDTENILGASPLLAIHRRKDQKIISVSTVVDITEYIMNNEPWSQDETVKRELAKLFPFALDFYSSDLGFQPVQDVDESVDDAINGEGYCPVQLISLLMTKLSERYTGQRMTTRSSDVSVAVAAKQISGAYIFCPASIKDAVLREASQLEISATLVAMCVLPEASLSLLSTAVPELLRAGAQPDFTHEDICHGATCLGALVTSHTPWEENGDEEHVWKSECNLFWTVFWLLADAGVGPRMDEESTIFEEFLFGELLKHKDMQHQTERVRKWVEEKCSADDLKRFNAALQPSNGDDDDGDDDDMMDDDDMADDEEGDE